jgi:hypothetical protein
VIDVFGWFVAALVVGAVVGIHYEVLLLVSDRVLPWAQRQWPGRRVMIVAMAVLFLGHIAEIWLFAIVMIVVLHIDGFGSLTGAFDGDFHAFLYFSAANYTSIGDGDIHSQGPIRALIFSETLTGLMMIAWSASFTFLKMEQVWQHHKKR